MNLEVHNDDSQFDRLVDGELSAEERQQLLASLDDRPDGWRRCALAFLEAQTWRGAMQQVVRESTVAEPRSVSVSAASEPRAKKNSRLASLGWLATAASLLLAFGLGWQVHTPTTPDGADLIVDAAPPTAANPNAEADPLAPALPDRDAITLVVHDRNGQPQRVQVPLVDGRRLGEQFGESPQWAAPAVRNEFAEHGIDLQTRRRYAPLFFEQQGGIVPMVVPVDDAVITPVSRPIY